eukprot:scaffold770_cov255-Pinguiococcus_pyrenoidosus.AAC.39
MEVFNMRSSRSAERFGTSSGFPCRPSHELCPRLSDLPDCKDPHLLNPSRVVSTTWCAPSLQVSSR